MPWQPNCANFEMKDLADYAPTMEVSVYLALQLQHSSERIRFAVKKAINVIRRRQVKMLLSVNLQATHVYAVGLASNSLFRCCLP